MCDNLKKMKLKVLTNVSFSVIRRDEFEVVGECDGKEIIRNDFGRTVADGVIMLTERKTENEWNN